MMIYYSDNTIFKRIFGVSMMIKQSEDDHFKDLYVIYEVMSGNLQNIEFKQLNQTNLVVYPPQSLTHGCIFNPWKPHRPQNRKSPFFRPGKLGGLPISKSQRLSCMVVYSVRVLLKW